MTYKYILPVVLTALLGGTSYLHAAATFPFSPSGEQAGSTAIHASSSLIVGWATEVANLTRGPQNIANPSLGNASVGVGENALGAANGSLVSLGDGGSITLSFNTAITNGLGTDFAVFENAFRQSSSSPLYFLELAFVEVSSNGLDFFRFPSISLTQTETQVGGFGNLDPTYIHNLAGKDLAGWGTAFDLADMLGISPLLDVNAVTHIRLIDVVGSINPLYASYDSLGNMINDPYSTPFASGGFDLDAIGVINQVPEPSRMLLILAGIAYGVTRRRKTNRCA